MAKSDLFNDYYINLMPIISKTACATKKLFSKKVTSAKFCNNKVPITLQYNVWSSSDRLLSRIFWFYFSQIGSLPNFSSPGGLLVDSLS